MCLLGYVCNTGGDINRYYADALYRSNDGRDICVRDLLSHSWIFDCNRFVSSRDFINYIKLRINALPSKTRLTRGRNVNKFCRFGCQKTETTYHAIQQCYKSHGLRIKRHDNVVKYIADKNIARGRMVLVEPKIQTAVGLRKPDLVIIEDKSAAIVDVQVVGNDINNLDQFHQNKVDYYSNNIGIRDFIAEKYGITDVVFGAVTISYKGIFNARSRGFLMANRFIGKGDLKIIASRVMLGSILCFKSFYKTT